ncbi:hypothetical protein J2S78_001308 [Salibacterium salarium]|uniref:YozQ family protein n=1 Tax=Salibacterium salarium TaxID=284579 RepID=UPI00277E7B1C|nr:YozQ family protein [Salibacterium salarium]MDQ0298888.1 hypothetical protein [Salibacterium salarium]
MDKKSTNTDKTNHPDDYNSNESVSRGLADTHEQVSDTYTAGTIDELNKRTSRKKQ